jgi:hypothetical protein
VTVKYKGTDQFNSSTASQTVTITSKDDSALIISQNPPSVDYDNNTTNLDEAVYQDLCVAVVDDNNNKIQFNRDDIELDYTRAVGEQEVVVKYKGNNYFKSAVATARVNIVQPNPNNPWLIAGIIGAIVIVLGIIGVVIYRKKHPRSN